MTHFNHCAGLWDVTLPYPATMHKVVDLPGDKIPSAMRPLQARHAADGDGRGGAGNCQSRL